MQLHHMPVTRSRVDSYHNCSPPSQQPENGIKLFRQIDALTEEPQARVRRPQPLLQSAYDSRIILRSVCGPKTPPVPSPHTPLTPICQTSVNAGKASETGGQTRSSCYKVQSSHFSFSPEDLLSKSLTRLDPRLLSRSGVYRQKSILDPDT